MGLLQRVEGEVARARQHLVFATTWSELDARLEKAGLRIEPRGQGLVVTDGIESVKVSSVAPGVSRRELEECFGVTYESTDAGTNGNPRKGLRERLKASESTLSAETVQRLSMLPERLTEAARTIAKQPRHQREVCWPLSLRDCSRHARERNVSGLAARFGP